MNYIFTERAHLMCPGMNFGITALINAQIDIEKIGEAVEKLSAVHPFLRAYIGYEADTDRYFYDITDSSKVSFGFEKEEPESIDDRLIIEKFESLNKKEWNLFKEGMLKISAWKIGEKTCFLFTFHHLLADGKGALELVREFADYFSRGTVSEIIEEKLIPSKEALPKNSQLNFLTGRLIKKFNKEWDKEGKKVSYESFLACADKYHEKENVTHTVNVTHPTELKDLRNTCHNFNVSVNDYLIAKMMVDNRTDKVIMAADIRDMLKCYKYGALGNYSTAFSIEVKKPSANLISTAQKVREEVNKKNENPSAFYLILQTYANLNGGLTDAAFISTQGDFDSKAGAFVGKKLLGYDKPSACSVTNLGRIESSVIEDAFFIPPASPAVKVTQGVLTVNNRMTICTSERK